MLSYMKIQIIPYLEKKGMIEYRKIISQQNLKITLLGTDNKINITNYISFLHPKAGSVGFR